MTSVLKPGSKRKGTELMTEYESEKYPGLYEMLLLDDPFNEINIFATELGKSPEDAKTVNTCLLYKLQTDMQLREYILDILTWQSNMNKEN